MIALEDYKEKESTICLRNKYCGMLGVALRTQVDKISGMLRTSAANTQRQNNEEESTRHRQDVAKVIRSTSNYAAIDWSKCFICQKKTYKKDRQLLNITT